MEQQTAQRRLVKSPPELWAEVSSEEALNRRLAEFGEIRITRVQPETTVAWEGDRASGTVELAPAGWGTKVILTATPTVPDVADAPDPPPAPDPPTLVANDPPPALERRGFLARLLRRRPKDPTPTHPEGSGPPAPGPVPSPPEPDPAPTVDRTAAILGEVLDDLGAAHHRPFSRD